MKPINVGSSERAGAAGSAPKPCAANALVDELHIAEIRPERLEEIAKASQSGDRDRPTIAS